MDTNVQLSESAAKRIAELMSKQQDSRTKLRISVDGGGCSGFQYRYIFEPQDAEEGDTILDKDGAVVLIDALSMDYMKNSVIDYVVTLGSANFEIRNPNSTASCGCGNSFSV